MFAQSIQPIHYTGRLNPVAEMPDHGTRVISIEHYFKTTTELKTALDVLRSRETLFYRDIKGRAIYCVLTSLEAAEAATGYAIKAQFTEVDYSNGVSIND
jgi:hypothetical protein